MKGTGAGEKESFKGQMQYKKVEGNANVPPLKVCEQKMEPILWEYGCFKRAIIFANFAKKMAFAIGQYTQIY